MGKAFPIGNQPLFEQMVGQPMSHSEIKAFVDDFKSRALENEGLDPRKLTEAIQFARRLIKIRRRRELVFGSRLFGEPVWDMLLDLFVSSRSSKPVAVSSLCIASAVPVTTALRWIETMEAAGLCKRYPDPNDGRRAFLVLTEGAIAGMVNLLCDPDTEC